MITVKPGDVIRFVLTFYHQGAAYSSGKAYVAVGNRVVVFDEKFYNQVSFSVPEDTNLTQRQVTVDLLVPSLNLDLTAGSGYEAYAKLQYIPEGEIIAYGPYDDITIQSPVQGAAFSNLQVSYAKA